MQASRASDDLKDRSCGPPTMRGQSARCEQVAAGGSEELPDLGSFDAKVTAGQWRDDGNCKPIAWYAAALAETRGKLTALERLPGNCSTREVLSYRNQYDALTDAGTGVYFAAYDAAGAQRWLEEWAAEWWGDAEA